MRKRPTSRRLLLLPLCVAAALAAGPATQASAQASEAAIISSPKFAMPPGSEAEGVGGNVVVAAAIDEHGTVRKADIVAGPGWPCGTSRKKTIDRVRDAVRANVLASTFSPAVRDGKPVESDVVLTFVVGSEFRGALEDAGFRAALAAGKTPPMLDVRVIAGKTASRPIRLPKPAYPPAARSARLSGPVPVRVVYDESGDVVSAGAIGGHPLLQEAARDSACSAKFEPMVIDGRTVKVTGVIVYNFFPGR